jgi:hypothetical protein
MSSDIHQQSCQATMVAIRVTVLKRLTAIVRTFRRYAKWEAENSEGFEVSYLFDCQRTHRWARGMLFQSLPDVLHQSRELGGQLHFLFGGGWEVLESS